MLKTFKVNQNYETTVKAVETGKLSSGKTVTYVHLSDGLPSVMFTKEAKNKIETILDVYEVTSLKELVGTKVWIKITRNGIYTNVSVLTYLLEEEEEDDEIILG